jgi:hypothetical protein
MIIIGVDYHPEFQQMAYVDTESGEFEERPVCPNCCYQSVNISYQNHDRSNASHLLARSVR